LSLRFSSYVSFSDFGGFFLLISDRKSLAQSSEAFLASDDTSQIALLIANMSLSLPFLFVAKYEAQLCRRLSCDFTAGLVRSRLDGRFPVFLPSLTAGLSVRENPNLLVWWGPLGFHP